MRSSFGCSAFGWRSNDSGSNSCPHQGQFSSGIGDGLRSGFFLNAVTFARAESGRPSPFRPRMLGVAAFPTQRPISNGHEPYRPPASRRSISSAQTSPAARAS